MSNGSGSMILRLGKSLMISSLSLGVLILICPVSKLTKRTSSCKNFLKIKFLFWPAILIISSKDLILEGVAINGTRKLLQWMDNNGHKFDDCIVGEPTNPNKLGEMIKIGRRGSITGKIKIIGEQCHVAYQHRGNNPSTTLVQILKEIKDIKFDKGNKHFQPTNLEVTKINIKNDADNIIANSSVISITDNDMRGYWQNWELGYHVDISDDGNRIFANGQGKSSNEADGGYINVYDWDGTDWNMHKNSSGNTKWSFRDALSLVGNSDVGGAGDGRNFGNNGMSVSSDGNRVIVNTTTSDIISTWDYTPSGSASWTMTQVE